MGVATAVWACMRERALPAPDWESAPATCARAQVHEWRDGEPSPALRFSCRVASPSPEVLFARSLFARVSGETPSGAAAAGQGPLPSLLQSYRLSLEARWAAARAGGDEGLDAGGGPEAWRRSYLVMQVRREKGLVRAEVDVLGTCWVGYCRAAGHRRWRGGCWGLGTGAGASCQACVPCRSAVDSSQPLRPRHTRQVRGGGEVAAVAEQLSSHFGAPLVPWGALAAELEPGVRRLGLKRGCFE
jgi:hypothetical protein